MSKNPDQFGLLTDCDACMANTTLETRQALGCGYEAAAPAGIKVQPWQPPAGKVGFDYGKDDRRAPKHCIGYTRKMPEVIEVARGRSYFDKGQLSTFCDGEEVTEIFKLLVETIDSEYHQVERWNFTPAADGGGRD